jgi:hypothetical protein
LRLRNDLQSQRCLPAHFSAIHFDNPAARNTADAKRIVNAENARWDHRDVQRIPLAELDNGVRPELFGKRSYRCLYLFDV